MAGQTFLKRRIGAAFVVMAVVVGGLAQGGVIYVNSVATGSDNGSSWTDAYVSLQDGLSAAVSGDEVWVAEGTYRPTVEVYGTGSRYRTFQLINGVAVYGGFAATGDPGLADRDPGTYVTILSGDIGTPGDGSDNCYHVFCHTGTIYLDSTAVLDGFVITGGNANGSSLDGAGAGMYNYMSSPTISNCVFIDNTGQLGGGMTNEGLSDPTISECQFSSNAATVGGGMYNTIDCKPVLTECTFGGNTAMSGGGMLNEQNSDPTLTDCVFSGNTTTSTGGGMHNYWDSEPNVIDCVFDGNTSGTGGGGMYTYGAVAPLVSGCTFSNNGAIFGGAMFNEAGCLVEVTDCEFIGNTATGGGGGMYNSNQSNAKLTSCVFANNTTTNSAGGGMYNHTSSPELMDCTFNSNSASSSGAMFNYSGSDPTMTDCTFVANTANNTGGAISNAASNPNLVRCSFIANYAVYSGGAIDNSLSNSYIEDCLFMGNTANQGAVIYNNESGSILFQCVFSGNEASNGAGIFNITSQPVLTNCTFSGNAATSGRAIACDTVQGSLPSTVEVTNCILWDDNGEIWNNDGSTITVSYSDVYGGYAGTGNIDVDPGFADAEGEDGLAGTEDDDLQLTAGSGCIDAGDNTAVAGTVTLDLAGEPRYFDDPVTADTGIGTAPIVDMGAYEIDTRVLEITNLTLKAGRTAGAGMDLFTIKGNLINYQAGDYVNGDEVILELGSVVNPFSVQAVFKQIGKGEKYLYRATVSGLAVILLDLDRGTFNITGKNVDLTGLEAPIEVRLTLGNYAGRGTAADSGANDVINGKRPVPLQFMSGYRNTFEVNAKFQAGKIANVGTLTLSGSIAAGNLLAAADTGPVTVTCGGQQFIASAGEFARKGAGRKYLYRGTKPANGSAYMATGQIDLDKCTFKLMFKDIDVSSFATPETVRLEFDQFDATADFSY